MSDYELEPEAYDAWFGHSETDDYYEDGYADEDGDGIGDWLPGETLKERNARILASNAATRERDRPDGAAGDPRQQTVAGVLPARVPALGAQRGAVLRDHASKPRRHTGAVLVTRASGDSEWASLRGDERAIRSFLTERALASRFDVDELTAPTPAGRLTEEERERRDELARCVAAARERGAHVQAIAAVIGRPLSTVNTLEARGRALLGLDG